MAISWIAILFSYQLMAAKHPTYDCSKKLQLSAEAEGKFKIGTKYVVSPKEQGFVREDGATIRVRIQNKGEQSCWRNFLCHHHYNYSFFGSNPKVKPPFGIYSPECKSGKPEEKAIGAHSNLEETLTVSLGKNIKPGKYWVQLKFFANPPIGDRATRNYTLDSVPFEIEVVQ